jgi:hypothetical protein
MFQTVVNIFQSGSVGEDTILRNGPMTGADSEIGKNHFTDDAVIGQDIKKDIYYFSGVIQPFLYRFDRALWVRES